MTRTRGVMEVECRLEGGVAAYLAGEEVRATVVFSLPPTADWEVRSTENIFRNISIHPNLCRWAWPGPQYSSTASAR